MMDPGTWRKVLGVMIAVRQSLILTALFVSALAILGHQGLSWGRLVLLIGVVWLARPINGRAATDAAAAAH